MINKAVDLLIAGEAVAIPTETVYGLAANAYKTDSVKKIYELKNRPSFNPLIVHVASLNQALKLAHFSKTALRLANCFWPGPLTLVLPLKSNLVAGEVTAGRDTIAIRMPSGQIAPEILSKLDFPLAAPSANPSNYLSPTSYAQVRDNFKNSNLYVVPSLERPLGIESTIIDVTGDKPEILRPGFITKEDIIFQTATYGRFINYHEEEEVTSGSSGLKSPGKMPKHYSPNSSIRLEATYARNDELALNFGGSNIHSRYSLNLSPKGDLVEAAGNLFDMLWRLDKFAASNNYKGIAAAKIPWKGIGMAINDKLYRAAG
jgi:L-threonylcarbamoyladenylate synthase